MTDVSEGKPAAIYVRISADREGRELGVERQEQDCREIAKRNSLNVISIYSDNDISASTRSRKPRPAYKAMLDEVRAGRITTLVASSSSRLTRRPREWEDLIDLYEQTGVQIYFVRSNDPLNLSTARGRRHARDDAARDAEYAEEISELARRERQQRREQGRWHGGNRPFGFERDGTTPRAAEQALIRNACEELLAGQSLAAIARHWTAIIGRPPQGQWCGRRDPSGKICRRRPGQGTRHPGEGACNRHVGLEQVTTGLDAWRPGSVRDVLINPRIAGMLPDGRPSQWEAVVDEGTWRAVAGVLTDPSRRHEKHRSRLLTGIAVCGVDRCPGHVYGGMDQYRRPTYRCSAARHMDRLIDPVDDLVTRVAIRYIARGGVRHADRDDGSESLEREKRLLQARLKEAGDRYASGTWPAETVDRITAAITAKLAEVERKMAASVAGSALAGLPLDEDLLRDLWATWDVDRRRTVLWATRIKVAIKPPGRGVKAFDPTTVRIWWPDDRED